MKRFLPWLIPALLPATQAHAQDAKLTIVPEHGKLIQQYVITERVQPVTVSFPLEVGATVPDVVHTEPVPLGLVAKAPEVRNYEYFVAGGKVVFVEPYTRKILQIVR
jgi:hypothetical protein